MPTCAGTPSTRSCARYPDGLGASGRNASEGHGGARHQHLLFRPARPGRVPDPAVFVVDLQPPLLREPERHRNTGRTQAVAADGGIGETEFEGFPVAAQARDPGAHLDRYRQPAAGPAQVVALLAIGLAVLAG